MAKTIALLLVATLIFAPWLLRPPQAGACTCVSLPAAAFYRDADVVVVGDIEQVSAAPRRSGFTVAVSEYLKGSGPGDLVVSQSGSSCDILVERGSTQLLFLRRDVQGALSTSLCSGSVPLVGVDVAFGNGRLEKVREYLALQTPAVTIAIATATRPPELPAGGSGTPSEQLDTAILVLIGAGTLGALAVLGAFALRRGTRA